MPNQNTNNQIDAANANMPVVANANAAGITVSNTNAATVTNTNAVVTNANVAETVTENTNTVASTTAAVSLPSWARIDFQNPSWDLFVVLFFVVASLLYGFSLGRDRIIIILISIYMALAVVQALPDFVLKVTLDQQVAFQITTFISLFVVLFFLISRSALMRTIGAGASDNGKWYQTIVFSVLHIGLLISITMSFLPLEALNKFAPLTKQIFTGEWEKFGWIIAPMLAMIIFGSKEGHAEEE